MVLNKSGVRLKVSFPEKKSFERVLNPRFHTGLQSPILSHSKHLEQMVFEIQLPHKIVNLLFTITNSNKILTVLRGDLTF